MSRRLLFIFGLIILLAGGIVGWMLFISGTGFSEKTRSFIIRDGQTDKAAVLTVMEQGHIFSNRTVFSVLASNVGVWDRIKPGKYEVARGQSMKKIAAMLRNGRVASVKLVINKVRTKEDLAKLISKTLAPDSVSVMNFLNSNDSLEKFHVDTSTVFTMIIPDSYSFYYLAVTK